MAVIPHRCPHPAFSWRGKQETLVAVDCLLAAPYMIDCSTEFDSLTQRDPQGRKCTRELPPVQPSHPLPKLLRRQTCSVWLSLLVNFFLYSLLFP